MGLGLWGLCCSAGFGRRQGGRIAMAGKAPGLRHIRTRTYTPKINGKGLPPRKRGPRAFSGETIHRTVFLSASLKTALNEWVYARAYRTSNPRAAHLPEWTHSYNWHMPHGGIGSQKPISRLGLAGDNLLRFDI